MYIKSYDVESKKYAAKTKTEKIWIQDGPHHQLYITSSYIPPQKKGL